MTAVIALIVGMLLAGVFIGELHARGTSLRDARHSLARKVSRAHGLHADPRETGPLNVLPTPLLTPPDGLPVAEQAAHADAMHALSEPYLPVHARTVPRRQTPDRQPWDTASFPALTETGAQRRCDFIKAQIPDPETASDDDLREAMAGAMASVSALPVFGEKPVADVLAAQEQEARYVA